MKNIIRKATTWMLVFGMTFTPVLTSIDMVAANAEEGTPTITVSEAKEKVEAEQKTANTPTPAGKEPTVENTGAQQLIENAQATVNTEVNNESGQTLLDTTNLSNDLGEAAEKMDAETGAQKNLADAAAAYDAAKKADDAVTSMLEGSTGVNAIVAYVQATDPETGDLLFTVNEDGTKTPVWEVAKDEQGNPITDELGNPVYVTTVVYLPIMPETFEENAKQTYGDAESTIKIAKKASSQLGKKLAEAELQKAEDGLVIAETDVAEAEAAVTAANALAKDALAKKNEAEAKVREAQEALEKALVQVGTDKDGNPVYAGNVEEAEDALKRAVEEAESLAGDAAEAIEKAQDAKLNLVQAKYQAVMDYVNGVEKSNWTDDATYRELARDLCAAVLNNFIEGQVGAEFNYGMNFVADRDLIVDWKYKNVDDEGNPIPTTRTDEDGKVLCDENGYPLYFIEYETVYGSFVEKVNGWIGPKDGEDSVYGWISSNKNQDNRVVVQYYQLEVDEDGNPVLDDDGNPVYAVDDKGEKILVTKFYNYKANKDGSIYIFERRYDIVDGEVVVEEVDPVTTKIIDQEYVPGVDPVEGKDEVPESWATEDGNKSIIIDQETKKPVRPNETTHFVERPANEDESKAGYWVVDTATSEKIGDQIDNADLNEKSENNGRKTVTYTVVEGTERETEEYSSYTVTDGYEPKTGPQNKKVNAFYMESTVRDLYDQGYDVKVTYKNWLTGEDESVDLDHQNGWQAFKAIIKGIFGVNSYTYSTTNTIDDLDKPITHDEDGIFVIKKANVVETTTVLEAQPTISTSDNRSRNENSVKTALNDKIAELRGDKNKTNISGEVKSKWIWDGFAWGHYEYYYEITYDYKTTSTQTLENVEISRQKYAADTLGKHTDYEAAVPKVEGKDPIEEQFHFDYTYGKDELKKEKVLWSDDKKGAFEGQEVYEASDYLDPLADYQQKLSDLQDQQSKLDQAVLDAKAALEKVQELKKQLAERQQIQLASVTAYTEFMEKLEDAEDDLEAAQKRVSQLEDKVEEAREAVRKIKIRQDEEDVPGKPGPDDGTPADITPLGVDPMTAILPAAGGATSGVAGVRVAAADAADDAVKTVATVEEKKEEAPVILEEEDLPAAAEATTLEDEELAGAQTIEEGASLWWIWLLIVLAAAAGYGVYKYVDNKKKNANTIQK
ncbi:MAG: hypothetical protein J5518_06250 [Lachnospiraceae bacterium]|nr:hypothetical protein [Lachnospiraceae bacterium]